MFFICLKKVESRAQNSNAQSNSIYVVFSAFYNRCWILCYLKCSIKQNWAFFVPNRKRPVGTLNSLCAEVIYYVTKLSGNFFPSSQTFEVLLRYKFMDERDVQMNCISKAGRFTFIRSLLFYSYKYFIIVLRKRNSIQGTFSSSYMDRKSIDYATAVI